MREIKFRAWDTELNLYDDLEWEGYRLNIRTGKLEKAHMVYDGDGHYDNMPEETDRYILEGYIGLKDKNGREIYEGDILSWGEGRYEFAKWKDKTTGVCHGHGDYGDDRNIGFYFGNYYGKPEESEVIGNIHENPELLK